MMKPMLAATPDNLEELAYPLLASPKFDGIRCIADCRGFEGVMLRKPDGPYKFGRSTVREGYLMKVKRFTQEEAVVVGYEEQETNLNEATKDALGHTKRSSHKAGKRPAGVLGALRVSNGHGEFSIGTDRKSTRL